MQIKTGSVYWWFRTKSMCPCGLNRKAYGPDKLNTRPPWVCSACGHPKPGLKALDIYILEDRPDGPLNFVFGETVGIARKSFLSLFGDKRVRRDLYLGTVFGPEGSPWRIGSPSGGSAC